MPGIAVNVKTNCYLLQLRPFISDHLDFGLGDLTSFSVLLEAEVIRQEEEGNGDDLVPGNLTAELMYLETDDVLDARMEEAWRHARFVLK